MAFLARSLRLAARPSWRTRSFSTEQFSKSVVERTVVMPFSSPKSTAENPDWPPVEGTSEIHIFLGPLNPAESEVKRYDKAVEEFNEKHLPNRRGATTVMRPVFLCLNFREAGDIFVMQSARHMESKDPEEVIEEAYYDGKFFADRGFEVLRHKIECFANTKGIPTTDEDALPYPNRYFEFHLRVNRNADAPDTAITDAEVDMLRQLSDEYTRKWGVPVPLSYNAYKKGFQRFLNFRIGYCGSETALSCVEAIKQQVAESTELNLLHVGKSHSEYVWFDDNRDLDRGWIDFTSAEQDRLFQSA